MWWAQQTQQSLRALAIDRLTTELLSEGLTPLATKCAMYGSNTDVARAAAADLDIAHHEHGVLVAGTPIGSDIFVKEFFQQKIQHVRAKLYLPRVLTFVFFFTRLSHSKKERANRGPRRTPEGTAPPKGRKEGGNAGQHGTRASHQDKWALLTRSLQLKLHHQSVPCQLCAPLLQAHTADLLRTARNVLCQLEA
jgi:hypothetical protein